MPLSKLSTLSLGLMISSALCVPIAVADDFLVDSVTVVTNGDAANVLDGNDTLQISATGAINVPDFNHAISASGSANTINNAGALSTTLGSGIRVENGNIISNSGSIATDSNVGFGIFSLDNNSIDNSGSITTLQNSSSGIYVQNDSEISNSGAITTSGIASLGLQMFNNNTVTNSGTVITNGLSSSAISAIGINNKIDNSGSLSTSGRFSVGIFAQGDENQITNSGSISTLDILSNGILAFGNNNGVTNSGDISTAGDGATGVQINNNSSLTNSGTITTTGELASGILAGSANVISNSGTINASGTSSAGILAIGNNDVSNSGTITASGDDSAAVVLEEDNHFTNSGTISASGLNSMAIKIGKQNNQFTNSGKVVSTQGKAFEVSGIDNTLFLQGPAFIGGEIDMGMDNRVDITTGASHSVLWTLEDVILTTDTPGLVPWAWDAGTQTFATLDPTALSAATEVLANNVGLMSELARTNNLPGEWWLKGYGNFGRIDASDVNNSFSHLTGGIAAGASFVLNENFDLGAFVGYQVSDLSVASHWVTSQTILGSGIVGGVYGTYASDGFFVDLALYSGFLGNSSDRFVNDNLAPLGEAHATADYNSFFLAPEIRVGINVDAGGGWTLTPSATSRFSNQWIDGYSETGSNANATVGARFVQVIEGELELAATRDLDAGELTIRGGIDYLQNLGAATQDVILQGQTLAIPVGNGGTFGGYVGVDFNYNLSDNMTLDLSAKTGLSANGYAVSGSIGVSGLF